MSTGSAAQPLAHQELALGTVQLGLDYGITNARGRLPDEEAARLLQRAWDGHIRLLDTAQAYGESERRLGALLPAAAANGWRVVTKTLPLRVANVEAGHVAAVDAAFRESLRRLGRPAVDGLLVHHAQDLLAPGGEQLYAWLRLQRERGLARRIGVSVYEGAEVAALLDRHAIDIVQLPASIADQRLVRDGSLARLRAAGVEVHVRSLFLQGLLLADPEFTARRFPAQASWVHGFHDECRRRGVTPPQACFGFYRSHPEFNAAVVGVSGADELALLLAAWESAGAMDWSGWDVDNTGFTDPRLWTNP